MSDARPACRSRQASTSRGVVYVAAAAAALSVCYAVSRHLARVRTARYAEGFVDGMERRHLHAVS